MKKILISLISGVIGLVIGTIGIVPLFNDVYVSLKGLGPGPDTESELLFYLIFLEWPLFFIIGVATGLLVHKRYLTNR